MYFFFKNLRLHNVSIQRNFYQSRLIMNVLEKNSLKGPLMTFEIILNFIKKNSAFIMLVFIYSFDKIRI